MLSGQGDRREIRSILIGKSGALIGDRHGDACGHRGSSDGHSPGRCAFHRLSQLSPLPNGAAPQISPESPIGDVYRYRVVGPPGYSVMDLKTLQDWALERRFKAVPGVTDVTGWAPPQATSVLRPPFRLPAARVLLAPPS
jgi:hypothetical protein